MTGEGHGHAPAWYYHEAIRQKVRGDVAAERAARCPRAERATWEARAAEHYARHSELLDTFARLGGRSARAGEGGGGAE